jgi:hypothetical protein
MGECNTYKNFIEPKGRATGKPVFHIEYVSRRPPTQRTTGGVTNSNRPGNSNKPGNKAAPGLPGVPSGEAEMYNVKWPNAKGAQLRDNMCLRGSGLGSRLSTVIKELSLGGWVMYCDGSVHTTVVGPGGHKAAPIPVRGGRKYTTDVVTTTGHDIEFDDNMTMSESDIEADPEHSATAWVAEDPDVSNIFFPTNDGTGSLATPWTEMPEEGTENIWEADVGPITEEDLRHDPEIVHRGAAKDWIGPDGPVTVSEWSPEGVSEWKAANEWTPVSDWTPVNA